MDKFDKREPNQHVTRSQWNSLLLIGPLNHNALITDWNHKIHWIDAGQMVMPRSVSVVEVSLIAPGFAAIQTDAIYLDHSIIIRRIASAQNGFEGGQTRGRRSLDLPHSRVILFFLGYTHARRVISHRHEDSAASPSVLLRES